MKGMRTLSVCLFVSVILILLFPACSGEQKQESILDKKVFIEKKLITKIPEVKRWCDRLELKKHQIDAGDARLYVEEEGEGIPLVLINGGPGGTHHYFHPWFSQARSFARIIYYDQRGCGLSDRKPGKDGYSVAQAVEDLDKIRKALKIDKWVVLGYSYGGFLAQLYNLTYPENMRGMILLGASPGFPMESGPSRQYDFITEAEKKRLKEIRLELGKLYKAKKIDRQEYIPILLYNNFLNGDWKRQNFYKPSKERLAEIALYEWDNDQGFNGVMGGSQSCYDFKGVFDNNPIPTLLLEGEWDLTWGKKKPQLFKANHPKAKMVIVKKAGHGIYDEKPHKFFPLLQEFISRLPKVPDKDVTLFKVSLKSWEKKVQAAKKAYTFLKNYNWDLESSKKLVKDFNKDWLTVYAGRDYNLLRMGFAFYDLKDFKQALKVFETMEKKAKKSTYKTVALIWQAHMLDLLKLRFEAVKLYKQVAELNSDDSMMHSQYRFKYNFSPYARKRLKEPFKYLPSTMKNI